MNYILNMIKNESFKNKQLYKPFSKEFQMSDQNQNQQTAEVVNAPAAAPKKAPVSKYSSSWISVKTWAGRNKIGSQQLAAIYVKRLAPSCLLRDPVSGKLLAIRGDAKKPASLKRGRKPKAV